MAMQPDAVNDDADDVLTPPPVVDIANLPPTPPPSSDKASTAGVQSLLDYCRLIKHGNVGKSDSLSSRSFRLTVGAYEEFLRRSSEDDSLWRFIKDKIRLEYCASDSLATIRMPSVIHEAFITSIFSEIITQLNLRRQQNDTIGQWMKCIIPLGSADVSLTSDDFGKSAQSKRSPDISFICKGAQYPGLIIEVGYTQQARKLSKAAEDYILEAEGNIRMVLGFETAQHRTGAANLYVWRPNIQTESNGDVTLSSKQTFQIEFRTAEGLPPSGTAAALVLTIADFGPKCLLPECDTSEAVVTITPQQLYSFLETAENASRDVAGGGRKDSLPQGFKKRRRASTPPDEITASDEAVYTAQEVADDERRSYEDRDWEEISTQVGRRQRRRH